jgi:hypothetical protein
MAIGCRDNSNVLPETLRQKVAKPRQRKPLYEIAFLEELVNLISGPP